MGIASHCLPATLVRPYPPLPKLVSTPSFDCIQPWVVHARIHAPAKPASKLTLSMPPHLPAHATNAACAHDINPHRQRRLSLTWRPSLCAISHRVLVHFRIFCTHNPIATPLALPANNVPPFRSNMLQQTPMAECFPNLGPRLAMMPYSGPSPLRSLPVPDLPLLRRPARHARCLNICPPPSKFRSLARPVPRYTPQPFFLDICTHAAFNVAGRTCEAPFRPPRTPKGRPLTRMERPGAPASPRLHHAQHLPRLLRHL